MASSNLRRWVGLTARTLSSDRTDRTRLRSDGSVIFSFVREKFDSYIFQTNGRRCLVTEQTDNLEEFGELAEAISNCDYDLVRKAIRDGENLNNLIDMEGLWADEYSDYDRCGEFLAPEQSVAPIHLAARCSDLQIIRLLLELGVQINKRTRWHIEGIKRFPDYDGDGRTAIEIAAGRGNVEMVKLLLEHGADSEANESDDKFFLPSPLHYAVHSGSIPTVKALATTRNTFSFDHLREAVIHDWTPLVQTILISGVVGFGSYSRLGNNAVDQTRDGNSGETLLDLSLEYGQIETAKLLIDSGFRSLRWLEKNSASWIFDLDPNEPEELPW